MQYTLLNLTNTIQGLPEASLLPAGPAVPVNVSELSAVTLAAIAANKVRCTPSPVTDVLAAHWTDATRTALSGARDAAVPIAGWRPSRKRRTVLWEAVKLADWQTTTATGGTISEAIDPSPDGRAGGTIVSMVDTAIGGQNVLKTPFVQFPGTGEIGDPWFFTVELNMTAANWVTVQLQDEANNNLLYVQLGLPANQIQVDAINGTPITVTPVGFSQNGDWRLLLHFTPTGVLTGDVRAFVYGAGMRAYVGMSSWSASNISPSRLKISQQNNAGNTMKVARAVASRMSGVLIGCSLEAGYVGWNMDPSIPRAVSAYNVRANPALSIASRLNGGPYVTSESNDYWINAAYGGYRVDQMLADFPQWVLALSPKQVVIGSATNSVAAAMSQPDPGAYMTTHKALYLSMVTSALAAGIQTAVCEIAPRHDTAISSLGLALYATLAKDWNAWLTTTILPLGVPVARLWTALEDPDTPNQLAPWADSGDHVHWTLQAKGVFGEAVAAAVQ